MDTEWIINFKKIDEEALDVLWKIARLKRLLVKELCVKQDGEKVNLHIQLGGQQLTEGTTDIKEYLRSSDDETYPVPEELISKLDEYKINLSLSPDVPEGYVRFEELYK